MLIVKASVRPSHIHNVGLSADEAIRRGTSVWQFDPRFDFVFDADEMADIPEFQRHFIKHFGALEKTSNAYILSLDDSRFMNHADDPNLEATKTGIIARRDIQKGEEMTIDYRLIDAQDALREESYLK